MPKSVTKLKIGGRRMRRRRREVLTNKTLFLKKLYEDLNGNAAYAGRTKLFEHAKVSGSVLLKMSHLEVGNF